MDFQAFGEELRKARTKKGRSLDDYAGQLKIHRRHLEAIEEGDLARLPQGPYVKAFVREYARALDVSIPESFVPPEGPPPRLDKDPKVVSRFVSQTAEQSREALRAREAKAAASVLPHPSAIPDAVKSAVKTVTKTTESVVTLVENSGKEALEVLTSKSLWDEAETVRRERLGLPPLPREIARKEEVARAQKEERDEAKVAAAFATESPILPPPVAHTPSASSLFNRGTSKRATNVVIGALAVLFAAAIYFTIRMSHSGSGTSAGDYVPAPVEKAPALVEPKKVEKPAASTTPAPSVSPTIAKDSLRFMLRAIQPVWVSISPDGIPAYRGQLKAGDIRSFRAAEKIVVDLGNQKSVEMQLDGQKLSNLPAIQNSSVVVRNLVLMRDRVTLGGAPVDFQKLTSAPPPNTQHSAALVTLPPAPGHGTTPTKLPVSTTTHTPLKTTPGSSKTPPKSAIPAASSKPVANQQPKSPTVPKVVPKKTSVKQSKKNQPSPGEIHIVEPIPPRP